MRTRLLHVADLHLGDSHDYLGPAAPARRSECDLVLRRVSEHALSPESGVAVMVISGDLFDLHHPPHALVESVLADLARVAAAGIVVVTVPGNHDEWSYPDCVYRSYAARWPGHLVSQPNPALVTRLEIGPRPVEIYSLAYVAGRTRIPLEPPELPRSDARRILLAHGSLDVDWSDRSLPIRGATLGEFDYVALGHIHRPMEKKLGRAWACYPGRIEGGGFDDPSWATIVTVDLATDELRPSRAPFPARPFLRERWNLSGLARREELEQRLRALLAQTPGAIARVELEGLADFPLDLTALQAAHASLAFHLELIDGRTAGDSFSLVDLAEEPTIRGAFARRALRGIAEATGEEERALAEAAARFGLAAFGAPSGSEPR